MSSNDQDKAPLSAGVQALFLLGAATMLAELVWARDLGLVIGSDAQGIALGVGVFLAGLGGGAALAARHPWSPRAWSIALVIGVVVVEGWLAMLPRIASGWGALSSTLVQILLATPIALPALAFGGAVPAWFRDGRARGRGATARRAGTWVAALDVGSAVGALATPLVVLPALGRWGASGVLVIVAAGAAFLTTPASSGGPKESTKPSDRSESTLGSWRVRVALAFLCGAIGFSLQVIWARLLGEILGTSLLVLGMAAAAMLLGGAIGSLLVPRILARGAATLLFVAWCLWTVAQVVSMFCLVRAPETYVALLQAWGSSAAVVQGVKITAVTLVVLPPAIFAGLLLPALAAAWSDDERELARATGRLQSAAIFGGVIGVFVTGLWALDALGSLTVVAGLAGITALITVGVCVISGDAKRPARWVGLGATAAAVVVAFQLASGSHELLGAGVFQWSRRDIAEADVIAAYGTREVLYSGEGKLARVTIEKSEARNTVYLKVGGRVEGTVPLNPGAPSDADLPTEILLGTLPTLFQGAAGAEHRGTFVIGIGGGTTAAAARAASGGAVTAAEVEPEVLAALASPAGREHFGWEAKHLLPEPRLVPPQPTPQAELILEDARAFLFRESRTWSAVIAQPSEPWLPWSSSLFTEEFFALVASRLAPGGVMVQWVQLYRISELELAAVVDGFSRAFDGAVWLVHPHPDASEVILVGGATALDLVAWRSRWREPGIAECRERFDWGEEPPLPLLSPAQVERWLAGRRDGTANVRSRLEFSLPLAGDRGDDRAGRILDGLRAFARQ